MLQQQTPYPYVGSFALLIDPDAAAPQAAELVRIQWRREGHVMVSFPLRDGASGNKVVPADQLIDASALTTEEAHEFHDLDRQLAGRSLRTARQKAMKLRRDALHQRMVYEPVMLRLLRQARSEGDRRRDPAGWGGRAGRGIAA
jgi:hypothetical protein